MTATISDGASGKTDGRPHRRQPRARSRNRGRALCEFIQTVSQVVDADQVLASGLQAILRYLGPGSHGAVVVYAGPELVPAGVLGWPRGGLYQGSAGSPIRAALPSAGDVLARLSAEHRAGVVSALGDPTTDRLLAVPLEVGGDRLGYILLSTGDETSQQGGSVDPPFNLSVASAMALAIDRLQRQRALEEANRAEEASRLKSEVLSVLSHQMRTPLASIKGYATALLAQGDEYDEDLRQEFLQVIDEETDKLTSLVGNLLESSAIEAGLLHLERQPVILPRLARHLVRQLAPRFASHRFVVSFRDHFPVVHADPGRIEQVLRNLLDNAVTYSPDGGLVTVRGTAHAHEVEVCVADQGVGIAPEHLNRLFERFYRVKGSLRRPVSGSGLGLPIARGIVDAHGGRIWAESTLERGSAFYFTLPLPPPEESLEG